MYHVSVPNLALRIKTSRDSKKKNYGLRNLNKISLKNIILYIMEQIRKLPLPTISMSHTRIKKNSLLTNYLFASFEVI